MSPSCSGSNNWCSKFNTTILDVHGWTMSADIEEHNTRARVVFPAVRETEVNCQSEGP